MGNSRKAVSSFSPSSDNAVTSAMSLNRTVALATATLSRKTMRTKGDCPTAIGIVIKATITVAPCQRIPFTSA